MTVNQRKVNMNTKNAESIGRILGVTVKSKRYALGKQEARDYFKLCVSDPYAAYKHACYEWYNVPLNVKRQGRNKAHDLVRNIRDGVDIASLRQPDQYEALITSFQDELGEIDLGRLT